MTHRSEIHSKPTMIRPQREHARYGSVMVAGPTRASLGPRSSRCGMLIDVELDPVVSAVSRAYLELVDAAQPAFHQADDSAAP